MATKSAGKKTSGAGARKAPKKKRAAETRDTSSQQTWTIQSAQQAGLDVALFIDPDTLTDQQKQTLQDFLDSIEVPVIAISSSHP